MLPITILSLIDLEQFASNNIRKTKCSDFAAARCTIVQNNQVTISCVFKLHASQGSHFYIIQIFLQVHTKVLVLKVSSDLIELLAE